MVYWWVTLWVPYEFLNKQVIPPKDQINMLLTRAMAMRLTQHQIIVEHILQPLIV